MRQHVNFVRNDVMPSFWANAIQRFLSVLAGNFRVEVATTTSLRVPAGPDDDAVAIGINGKWRWIEETVTRAVPGIIGRYDVFVTAADNRIVNIPQPFTDQTNYAFDLAVVASGSTPLVVPGTVDIYRKVAWFNMTAEGITNLTVLAGQTAGVVTPGDPRLTPGANAAATVRRLGNLAGEAASGAELYAEMSKWRLLETTGSIWGDLEANRSVAMGNAIGALFGSGYLNTPYAVSAVFQFLQGFWNVPPRTMRLRIQAEFISPIPVTTTVTFSLYRVNGIGSYSGGPGIILGAHVASCQISGALGGGFAYWSQSGDVDLPVNPDGPYVIIATSSAPIATNGGIGWMRCKLLYRHV